MPHNVIDAELSEADFTAIRDGITAIRALMPFTVDLSSDDRRKLFSLGPGSLAFVRDSLSVAQNHDEILPRGFDVDEFARDFKLTEQLDQILIDLRRLFEGVDDTRRLVGTEAMRHARLVYKQVKNAPTGSNLDAVAAQLGERFKRRNNNNNNSGNGTE